MPDRWRPPSGIQHVIAHGDWEAQISQVGATLRSCRVGQQDVIDGFDLAERASDGRGQVLAPWPNRLTDGSYRYGGRDCQAPLNELSRHDAIHGFVRWLDWTLVEHRPATAVLACAVRPQPGYEWHLDLRVTYHLGNDGLTVAFEAVNADRERAPFGVGFHPYLTLGTPIDGLSLTVPAAACLAPGPSGDLLADVDATDQDFREPRRLGSTRLDTAFGHLLRGPDGNAVARLGEPTSGRSVELWVDAAFRYLMVYTADDVGRPERRRSAVAVEPMTCPPDALRSGSDLVELEPGESWRGTWGLRRGPAPR